MVVLQFSNKTVARQDRSLISPKNSFALIQTSFDRAPVLVWPGNPKGGPSAVEPLLAAFPELDHEWMALQQHVIELTDKPIEDVTWGELGTLRATLTEAEMSAVLSYRRRKNMEASAALNGVVKAQRDPEGWEDWKCDKTYEWMLHFQDYMRALLLTIEHSSENNNYQRVLRKIDRELFDILERYPDRTWEPEDGWSVGCRLAYNIPRVFPNDEGFEVLKRWWNLLDRRSKELKRQQKLQKQPDQWIKLACKRRDNLEKVCQLGLKLGVITRTGKLNRSMLWFRGSLLGKGLRKAVQQMTEDNYQLEAELRLAVKVAADAAASPIMQ